MNVLFHPYIWEAARKRTGQDGDRIFLIPPRADTSSTSLARTTSVQLNLVEQDAVSALSHRADLELFVSSLTKA